MMNLDSAPAMPPIDWSLGPEGPEKQAALGRKALLAGDYETSRQHLRECLRLTAKESPVKRRTLPPAPERGKVGRFVYLPVEVSARELPAKAKLAGQLADAGFTVLVGAAWEFVDLGWSTLPPGLVLFKTMNAMDAFNIFEAQKAGHLTAALNEEFFAVKPEQWIYEAECHPSALANVDLICAYGMASSDIFRAMGRESMVTGSPRSEISTTLPRDSYGHPTGGEILICCMGGTINNTGDFCWYMERQFDVFGSAEAPQQRLVAEQIDYECNSLPLIFQATRDVARDHPNLTIRVRPHPAERANLYADLLDLPNVVIDDRTPLPERLKEAQVALFISGCGCGVDATLAQVPAVRLGTGGHGLSGDLGEPYSRGVVRGLLSGIQRPRDNRAFLERHFAPDCLAQTLIDYLKDRSRPMRIDFHRMWQHIENKFQSNAFVAAKFPEVSETRMHELCGRPAKSVGWRMWLVT